MADPTHPEDQGTAATVERIVARHINPHTRKVEGPAIPGADANVLILPAGMTAQSVKPFLDPFRTRPERRKGTAHLGDLDSLIAHVNRFRDIDSALFAEAGGDAPSITAVLDYHEALRAQAPDADGMIDRGIVAMPRFGEHRAIYRFPLSREWLAWKKHDGAKFDQVDFAAFLEERILDILPPPALDRPDMSAADAELKRLRDLLRGHFASPEKMMDLARGLQVHEKSTVVNAANLSTGEGHIVFRDEHTDENGEKLAVPNLFCIAIPVFEHGAIYRLTVRLRYRKAGGSIIWIYQLYQPERPFEAALKDACALAAAETGLPLYYGSPEA